MAGTTASAPTGRSVDVSLCAGGQSACCLVPWLRLDQVVPVEGVLLEPARPREPCGQPRCEAGGVEEPTLIPRSAAVRVRLEEQDLTVLTETINACVHGTAPGQDRYDAFGPLRVLHANGRLTSRQVVASDAGALTKQRQQSVVRAEAAVSDLAIQARKPLRRTVARGQLSTVAMVDRYGIQCRLVRDVLVRFRLTTEVSPHRLATLGDCFTEVGPESLKVNEANLRTQVDETPECAIAACSLIAVATMLKGTGPRASPAFTGARRLPGWAGPQPLPPRGSDRGGGSPIRVSTRRLSRPRTLLLGLAAWGGALLPAAVSRRPACGAAAVGACGAGQPRRSHAAPLWWRRRNAARRRRTGSRRRPVGRCG